MSFAKLDHWIGRTLFVPPIVKLCQLTRQSQFAISRLFWFIAALDGLYRAETVVGMVIWGGMSVIAMLTAASRADHPTISFMFFRLLAVALLGLDLLRGVVTGDWAGTEFWFFVLVAEYAAIIRTIPPAATATRAVKEATARQSAETRRAESPAARVPSGTRKRKPLSYSTLAKQAFNSTPWRDWVMVG